MADRSNSEALSDAGPEPTSATSEKHTAPGGSSGPPSDSAANKRRRGLGIVTPNACTECRKKRAKVGLALCDYTLGTPGRAVKKLINMPVL